MGMFWNYYTVSRDSWESVFGGKSTASIKHVLASYMWDRLDGNEPDIETDREAWLQALIQQAPRPIIKLVTDLCENGFSYAQRSAEEAGILDELVSGFFAAEGLADVLNIRSEGGDGIKSFILEELLKRSLPVKTGGFLGFGGKQQPGTAIELLPFIVSGRRVGNNERPCQESQYFVFWENELPQLRSEIELLLRQNRPWSHPGFEAVVKDNILAAVISAESSNRILFGRYCG